MPHSPHILNVGIKAGKVVTVPNKGFAVVRLLFFIVLMAGVYWFLTSGQLKKLPKISLPARLPSASGVQFSPDSDAGFEAFKRYYRGR